MIGPYVSLNVGIPVVDEVHVTLSADLDTVVAVITVIGGAEILEFEPSGDINVSVAAVLVEIPIVGGYAVVKVWSSVGGP